MSHEDTKKHSEIEQEPQKVEQNIEKIPYRS